MILFKVCLVVFFVAPTFAVLNKNDVKREAPFEKYGPPPVPHRTYGVPQQVPFREYGPPPAKLNFGSSYGGGYKHNNFHEHVIKHFKVPKPVYGPPPHKPVQIYGPPQHKPFTNYGPPPKPAKVYGPPAKIYGPPAKPHYGPPPKHFTTYGPPRPAPVYGPPPQPLPHFKPAPLFKPAGIPHQNYGPPPVPHKNYGPPQPAPVYEPPSTSYGVPETTVIVAGNHQGGSVDSLPLVENHSNHFGHAGCDGWKPIAGPVGHYVEHNAISETTGYSNVAVNGVNDVAPTSFGAEQGSLNGITDEQLVAIALQSNQGGSIQYTAGQSGSGTVFASGAGGEFLQQQPQYQPEIVHQQLPEPAIPQNFHVQQQVDLSSANLVTTSDDTYSRPPSDSYAPNSVHAHKYENHNNVAVVVPSIQYGPPPQVNQPFENYGPPPISQPTQEYGPPKVSGNAYHNLHTETFQQSLPLAQPQQPLAFRQPVPAGLIENVAASVEHFDNNGINQQSQLNTYIPPHINEYPQQQQQQVVVQVQEQNFNNQYHQQQQQQQYQQQHYQQQFQQQHYQQPEVQLQFNQQPDIQTINSHNCGHGPNLAGGNYQVGPQQLTGYNNIVTGGYSIGEQQQQFIQQPANSYGPPPSGNIVEQQQVFIQKPADSYGPPASGNVLDVSGYESKQSSVIASLPGLDGLNVLSAHKSEGVQLPNDYSQGEATQKFEIRAEGNGNNNADELIDEGLIQKILSAVEEKKDAQSRSDDDVEKNEHVDSTDSAEESKE